MVKNAQASQRAFKELLDMKQKQANIFEAQLARKQTEVMAYQSRSVMIFTIFTIIFLPLSFFASIFGMNAREWSGVSTNMNLYSIFTYMGSISLGVIVIALLVAFNRLTRSVVGRVWAPVSAIWESYVEPVLLSLALSGLQIIGKCAIRSTNLAAHLKGTRRRQLDGVMV